MTTQTLTLPVPTLGEDPTFDEFVEAQLSRYSDFLDEEKSRAWEGMAASYADEWTPADDFRAWWEERLEQLRAELWQEWIGGTSIDAWEVLQENEALRQQAAEKDGTIQRLRERVRRLKRQKAATEEDLYYVRAELQAERDVTAYLREEKRCRDCNGRMFGS